ncbi:MAG: outer membrane lipoprotein-sorting protein [Gammaproteobacteria bacterium]|nr:outer membrane lipoprotein-sorting protein [Gammaproteobacteria bacterium]
MQLRYQYHRKRDRSFMHRLVWTALFLGLGFAAFSSVQAQTAEERGLEIEIERDKRDTGWGDSKATLRMILRNRQGQESTRELRNQSLEQLDDGDWALIVFDDPRDVKGTALLSYTHKVGPDDQWLYLPALKRVKRIASNNKAGPFVGSEFAYEDISSQETEKYTYKYIEDESFDGRDHFVVERYPVDPKSGYTRQMVWLDKDEYRVWKIDYYDRKDSLLKTLTQSEFNEYLDEYWRPHRMEMVNHQTGKSTTLMFSDYEFRTGVDERDFNQNSLRKAR